MTSTAATGARQVGTRVAVPARRTRAEGAEHSKMHMMKGRTRTGAPVQEEGRGGSAIAHLDEGLWAACPAVPGRFDARPGR